MRSLFAEVEPIEITDKALLEENPEELARRLPRFTSIQEAGGNPAFGLLVDPKSGRIWALRSGLSPLVEETFNGIRFKSGIMTRPIATQAGGVWGQPGNPLGAHLEGQAVAFMRKTELMEAVLYINGSTPCLSPGGCKANLPVLLAANATLVVYNKNGRQFDFTGVAD